MALARWAFIAVLATVAIAEAESDSEQPRRSMQFEIKLGSYRPFLDQEAGLSGQPFTSVFGTGGILLFALEVDKILWQKYGSLGLGFSAAYGEKYGPARLVGSSDPTAQTTDKTSIKVIPLRLLGMYRLDYPALHWGFPLVPYGKAALIYMPWWITKGAGIEYSNGRRASGGRWGYGFTAGVSFLLDVLEPRMAKDFAIDVGVLHSYLFAEYTFDTVTGFGKPGFNFSGRYWMFGIAVDF